MSGQYDSVTVVISAYNEAATIEAEIRELHRTIVSRIPGSEFIVAEDGSTDGTKDIIHRLAGELGIIHSTSEKRKGYAQALRDAFNLARCQYIFFSDTGGKHDPEDFWKLYREREGHGLVVGVKTGRTDQWYRRLLTSGYNLVLSGFFRVRVHDADSGFRVYSRDAARKVFNEPWVNNALVASEITLRVIYSGFAVKEVAISYRQREGQSRGLPTGKIPGVIAGVLRNFPRLRRALSAPGYAGGGPAGAGGVEAR